MWEEGDDVYFGWECGVWCLEHIYSSAPDQAAIFPRKIVLSSRMFMATIMLHLCPVGAGQQPHCPTALLNLSLSLFNLDNYSIKYIQR